MAPYIGPSREQVLRWLRSANPRSRLPITLGVYAPQAVIDREDGSWVLCPLELDRNAANEAGEEALADGKSWMPEMEWEFLERAKPIVSTTTVAEFISAVETMEWQWDVPGAQ